MRCWKSNAPVIRRSPRPISNGRSIISPGSSGLSLAAREKNRVDPRHQIRPRSDRARTRQRGRRAAAVVPDHAGQRSRRSRLAAEESRHQERAAQRHHAGHRGGGRLHRSQGHRDRNLFRFRLRAAGRQFQRRHAAQTRPRRLSMPRRAGPGEILLRRSRLSRLGLARRFLRLPALQPRSSHREFPARPQDRDPSHRLRGARLDRHQARLATSWRRAMSTSPGGRSATSSGTTSPSITRTRTAW